MNKKMNLIFLIFLILFNFISIIKANKCDFQDSLQSFYSLSKFQFKNIDLTFKEYKYKKKSKFEVKFLNTKNEIIYDTNEDHFYKMQENDLKYEKIDINKIKKFSEVESYLKLISYNQNKVYVGPTSLLYEVSINESELESDSLTRSMKTSVCSLKKENLFGLSNVEIKIYFKLKQNLKIPIRSTITFNEENENKIFIIDYYEFINYNQISNYELFLKSKIIPSVSSKNMFDFDLEKPNFVFKNKMKFTFNIISEDEKINHLTTIFIDKEENLYRYEAEKKFIFDFNNKVQYELEDEKCSLYYYNSEKKFDNLKKVFFNLAIMIEQFNLNDFDFIGYDYENGYERKIFQKIVSQDEKSFITKLFFNQNNLEKISNETRNSNGELIDQKIINILEAEVLKYDKTYRDLFSIKNCFLDQSTHLYAQIYTDSLKEDINLPLKIKYFEKNKDEIVKQILLHFKDELGLKINSFSFAEIERKANYFVFNILILNVENYLISFKNVGTDKIKKKFMNPNLNQCALKALKDEKVEQFNFCQNKFDSSDYRCSLSKNQEFLLSDSKASDFSCYLFQKKKEKSYQSNYDRIDKIFTNLIKKHFAIQFEHQVKFVFNNIRFFKKFSNTEDEKELFYKHKSFYKFENPKKEFNDGFESKILSVYDCYLHCKNQKKFDCNSFSFCEDRNKKIKCQLSDTVLSNYDNQIINSFKKANLSKDKNCYIYGLNYLNHFDAKGNSILAPNYNLKSYYFSNIEDCAKSCFFYNQNKDIESSCGKIEFCQTDETKKNYLCNLKQLSSENSVLLNNESCNYYKLNPLIDFQKVQYDEDNNYNIHSYSTLKDCAKSCLIDGLSCTRFNFCLDKLNFVSTNDENLGLCLKKTESFSKKFNNSNYPALTCLSLIKNNEIYSYDINDDDHRLPKSYNVTRYKNKYIKEFHNENLKPNSFKAFVFTFFCLGILFGIFGFIYYNKSIGPSYNAEKGTYYPTRIIKTITERVK